MRTAKGLKEPFKRDGSICYLHCGGVLWEYTPTDVHQTVLFKYVLFLVQKLYLNEVIFKNKHTIQFIKKEFWNHIFLQEKALAQAPSGVWHIVVLNTQSCSRQCLVHSSAKC